MVFCQPGELKSNHSSPFYVLVFKVTEKEEPVPKRRRQELTQARTHPQQHMIPASSDAPPPAEPTNHVARLKFDDENGDTRVTEDAIDAVFDEWSGDAEWRAGDGDYYNNGNY